MEKYCRAGRATIWRMHIACWIHKAKNKHSENVLHLAFFSVTVVARMRLTVVIRTLPVYSSSFAPKTHTCYMASPSHDA